MQVVDEGARLGSLTTGRVGDGRKLTGRLERRAWRGQEVADGMEEEGAGTLVSVWRTQVVTGAEEGDAAVSAKKCKAHFRGF